MVSLHSTNVGGAVRALALHEGVTRSLAEPWWNRLWTSCINSVKAPMHPSSDVAHAQLMTAAASEVQTSGGQPQPLLGGYKPRPQQLHFAQVENQLWRQALLLLTEMGVKDAGSAKGEAKFVQGGWTAQRQEAVAMALLVQCPPGTAHLAAKLLDLSPLRELSAPPSAGAPAQTSSRRARLSLRVMLREGPLSDENVAQDLSAATGLPDADRSSYFLPQPVVDVSDTLNMLPLQPGWMYWPLKTLSGVMTLTKVVRLR